jgi:hypothetical protein
MEIADSERAFDNDEVLHVDDSIDPVRDLSEICHRAFRVRLSADEVKRYYSERALQEGSW